MPGGVAGVQPQGCPLCRLSRRNGGGRRATCRDTTSVGQASKAAEASSGAARSNKHTVDRCEGARAYRRALARSLAVLQQIGRTLTHARLG